MGVKSLTRKEKIEWLDGRLDEMRRARALIQRFEDVSARWLKKAVEANKTK